MAIFKAPKITTAQRGVLTLDVSELVYDIDEKTFYGGDGSTEGGFLIGEASVEALRSDLENALEAEETARITGDENLNTRVSDLEDLNALYEGSFENISKNLKSWNALFNYTGTDLTSIVYTDGADTITKTFNYTGTDLTSIVLSGDTPSGISLTKTLNYFDGNLTSITYS
jgi:hypothetical protein